MSLISPWTYSDLDPEGRLFSVTFTFDNTTGTLLTISTHRDPGCSYTKFYIGLGADGRPDSTASQFAVADGDGLVALAILTGFGFTTISDLLAHQVTCGP